MNKYPKEQLLINLQRELTPHPTHDGQHQFKFFSREDVAIEIVVQKQINKRHIWVGGPSCSAMLDFGTHETIAISYLDARNRPVEVKNSEICEMIFHYWTEL